VDVLWNKASVHQVGHCLSLLQCGVYWPLHKYPFDIVSFCTGWTCMTWQLSESLLISLFPCLCNGRKIPSTKNTDIRFHKLWSRNCILWPMQWPRKRPVFNYLLWGNTDTKVVLCSLNSSKFLGKICPSSCTNIFAISQLVLSTEI